MLCIIFFCSSTFPPFGFYCLFNPVCFHSLATHCVVRAKLFHPPFARRLPPNTFNGKNPEIPTQGRPVEDIQDASRLSLMLHMVDTKERQDANMAESFWTTGIVAGDIFDKYLNPHYDEQSKKLLSNHNNFSKKPESFYDSYS